MIGIIAAMDEELAEILVLMDNKTIQTVGPTTFHLGTIANKSVVAMKSGVGKVLAAMTTTQLLERYDIDYLINIGTAGGLSNQLQVLDVIVGKRLAQWDMDLTAFNYQRSFDEPRITVKNQGILMEQAKLLVQTSSRIFVGDMVSGDQFISTPQQIELIKEHFPTALCADMEAAAIGSVANVYHVDFIVLRSLSDIVVTDDNQITFESYIKKASANAAGLCYNLITQLPLSEMV